MDLTLEPPPGRANTAANTGNYIGWEPNKTDATKGRLIWSFHYKNYGKSPAIVSVPIDEHFEVGPDALKKVKSYTIAHNSKQILVPTQDIYTSVFSREISVQERDLFSQHDDQFVIFGRIDYEGLDGGSYWTEFCLGRLVTTASRYCSVHNGTK